MAVPIRGVHRPTHAVFVVAHVAVGHADGLDIGVDEARVPRHRVGDAVDVVPPPGIEAHEVAAQGGTDLHQLEGRFDLLDEDIGLDRAYRQPEVLLKRREQVVPERGLLGGLDLRQVEDDRCPRVEVGAGGC